MSNKNQIKMKTNYTTIEEVKADDDYASGLELLADYGISAYLIYRGGDKVEYYVFLNRGLLFSGNDYKPSPMVSIDGLKSIIGLLGFITVREGDTDLGYFKNYSKDQIEWTRTNDCENLSVLLSDYENTDEPEYNESAKEKLESNFIYG